MSVSTARRVAAGLCLAGGITAGTLLLSPERTLSTVAGLADDPLVFGVVVAGLYLLRPLFAWPTTPLALVVGYGYGVTLGIPVALVGVVVTAVPVHVVVRRLVADVDETNPDAIPFGSALERADRVVTGYYDSVGPVRGVIASRLAPIPADVATAAAASSGIGLGHLVVGTFVGELPWTVAAVVVGASAATVTASGLGEIGAPLAIGCLFAAALLVAGPVYRVAHDSA